MSTDGVTGGEREIELKLLAEPDVLARLRRSPLIGRYAEGKSDTRPLLSVYYDTPDLALHRKGLALRVRKEGAVHVQTVKTEGVPGAASNRAEFETVLPDGRPDPERIADPAVRRLVTKQVARLKPFYETEIRRTRRTLVTPEGDKIELAIDTGTIRADGAEEPVSELELELKSGQPAALFRIAAPIAERFDVRLGVLSKAARGYALAAGKTAARPVKWSPPLLDASMTAEEACRTVLASCLSQIVANEPAVVMARDPEGVHQMRVGLRRFRSAAESFPWLEPWLGPLAAEARRIASRLGRARDLDVFVDTMLAPLEEGVPGHGGLAGLRSAALARREAAWVKARSAAASRRFTCFVIAVAAALEERPWRQPGAAAEAGAAAADILDLPAGSLARRLLDEHYARARKSARKLDSLTTEQRHALRIELKRLRYSADFFAPLFPKKTVKPFSKALSGLQDAFGYLNDAAVAERLCRKLVKQAADAKKGALREAGGIVIGWHAHRAAGEWRDARKRWRALEKIDPFWRS